MKRAYNCIILIILIYIIDGNKADEISINDDLKDVQYFERITKSRYFVDKTKLLRVFLQHERPSEAKDYAKDLETRAIAFTCPKGFGKSTNLDMVRRFFQIPFNETTGRPIYKGETHYYKLFTNIVLNLEISHDENFIEQHFGEYPMIYLDFANMQGKTTDDVMVSIQKEIGRVIKSYRWLCAKNRRENKNATGHRLQQHLINFKKIFEKTANANDSVHALEGLAELLAQHFDKTKIMVLIDNYDTPITYALSNSIHAEGIHDFMHFLLRKFVQYEHVSCHVMILGTTMWSFIKWQDTIGYSSSLPWTSAIQRNFFLRCPTEFGKYFGFTVIEVDRLLTSNKIHSCEREKIKEYFNNYKFSDPEHISWTNLSLYHPTGVVQYLETNVIQDNLLNTDTFMVHRITPCLKYKTIFSELAEILIKQRVLISMDKTEHFEACLSLNNFAQMIENNCSSQSLSAEFLDTVRGHFNFYTVLFDNGYISLAQSGIQIPNKMAEIQLKRYINKFFYDSYAINVTNAEINTRIQSILNSRTTTDEMLTNLRDSLQKMIDFINNLDEYKFQSFMFGTLINHIDSTQEQYLIMEQKKIDKKPFDVVKQSMDRLLLQNHDKKIALIVTVSYHKTLQKAVDSANKYEPLRWATFNADITLIKYLGINLNGMNQVEVGKGDNRNWRQIHH